MVNVTAGTAYTSGTGNVSSGTVSLVSGTTTGDVTVLLVVANCTAAAITAPAGWTETVASFQASNTTTAAMAVLSRAYQAGDGDVTVSISASGRLLIVPLRVTGANTATPFSAASQATGTQAGGSIAAPSVSGGTSGQTYLTLHGGRATTSGVTGITTTPPSGLSELADSCTANTGNFNVIAEAAYGTLAADGATGTSTATASASITALAATLLVVPASTSASGSVALAGSGTLTLAGAPAFSGTLARTGSGTLNLGGGVTAYDSIVLSDNPTAYWAIDGTGATDLTGGGLNGTLHGTVTSTTVPGGGGTAALFDGTAGNYIEIPDNNKLSVSTTGILTIEAWMRPDNLNPTLQEGSGYVWWMGKGVTDQHEWACRMYGTSPTGGDAGRINRISGYAFNLTGGLGTGSYFQDTVTAGQWIHYTLVINTVNTSATYPHGYVKIYKNGVQRDQDDLYATAPIVPANGTAPFRIGTRDFNSYFPGAIGKVAIYGHELPQSRIVAHARALVPPPGSGTGSFVKTVGTVVSETSGTSIVIPVPSAGVAAGSTLIVRTAHDYTSAAPTISDTKGNTYTRDRTSANGTAMRMTLWSAPVTAALTSSDSITITLPTAVVAKAAVASQFAGLATPTVIDAQNGQAATSTTPQAGGSGVTTTYADTVLIATLGVRGPDSDTFTEDDTVNLYNQTARVGTDLGSNDITLNTAYRSISTAGAYNYKPTLGTSRDWIDFLIAYKATPATLHAIGGTAGIVGGTAGTV